MVHNGSLSLHTVLEESSGEGDAASGGGKSFGFPSPRGCNVVTPIVSITTTPSSENTPALSTILTVLLWTAAPQPRTRLLPKQQQAYQEEQQARIRARQINAERRAAQWQDELAGERASIDAQLIELHHRKSMLETERATKIDVTKARARARAITTAINREGVPRSTFTKASQTVAVTAALLETLPAPSVDRVDKVYYQLKGIIGVIAAQQVESSLQRRADVSISSPDCSKANQAKTGTELPTAGTASSSK
jgi:hypothetical protein